MQTVNTSLFSVCALLCVRPSSRITYIMIVYQGRVVLVVLVAIVVPHHGKLLLVKVKEVINSVDAVSCGCFFFFPYILRCCFWPTW
jgi:hypothetical protein